MTNDDVSPHNTPTHTLSHTHTHTHTHDDDDDDDDGDDEHMMNELIKRIKTECLYENHM